MIQFSKNDEFNPDLGEFDELVSCNECGDMISIQAVNFVYSNGYICNDCLAQNVGTMFKCESCLVVLRSEELIDLTYCPDCGNIVETED